MACCHSVHSGEVSAGKRLKLSAFKFSPILDDFLLDSNISRFHCHHDNEFRELVFEHVFGGRFLVVSDYLCTAAAERQGSIAM